MSHPQPEGQFIISQEKNMSGTMTSRERVYATLRHEEPDRVPIDFASNYNTSVNVIAYNRLKE